MAATSAFKFVNPDAVAFRVMRELPDLEGMPDDLRDLVESCLEKEPGRTTPTTQILAGQTADLLGRALSAEAAEAVPPSGAGRGDLPLPGRR